MSNRQRFVIALFLVIPLMGCQLAPPYGWRTPVYKLLIDNSNLPSSWRFNSVESSTSTDQTTNHVYRSWINEMGNIASESIWRAYTIDDAKKKYNQLRQEFEILRPLEPKSRIYVEFKPPSEISYKSQKANDFYLACGWIDRPYCRTIAQYRNYIVEIWTDQKAEFNGVQANGLTYAEIETIIKAMDEKFIEFMAASLITSP